MKTWTKRLRQGPTAHSYRDDDDTDIIQGDGSTFGGTTYGDGGDIDTDSDKDRRGRRR